MLQRWLLHWENLCHIQQQQPQRPQANAESLWKWSEFEGSLEARNRLWAQNLPRELDPLHNRNMAAHLGLKSLRLELYNDTIVQIT
jgi:hypothetical protein